MIPLKAAAGLGVMLWAWDGAWAQPVCGLRNTMTLTAAVPTGTNGQTFYDTGWVGPEPLVLPAMKRSVAGGCRAEASFLSDSRYGLLHFSGFGEANVCALGGVFLGARALPAGEFRDRITIVSGVLPVGTAVTLREHLTLIGGASVSTPGSTWSFGASFHILNRANAPGTVSGLTFQSVGNVLDISGNLFCTADDQALPAGGSNGVLSGSIAADVTAIMWIEVLTPGAFVVSCSGHDYSIGGCAADVDDGSGSGVPDGGVTIDDLVYYLSEYETGGVRADVDDGSGTGTPDGGVTIDDLIYYLTRFELGC